MGTSQLAELAKPFPDDYIHRNPSGGGSYVKHHVVVQRLLSIVGGYDFELVEVIRGTVAAIPPNPSGNSKRAKEGRPELSNAIVGAVCRLTVTVDGKVRRIEEVGDCEEPHNWPHDGARLKDAMSDAIKRCAARLGLGLHLWSQEEYWLHRFLEQNTGEGENAEASPAADELPDQTSTDETVEAPGTPPGPHPQAYNGDWPPRLDDYGWDDAAVTMAEHHSLQATDKAVVDEIDRRKALMKPIHTRLASLTDDDGKDRLLRGYFRAGSWKQIPADRLQRLLNADEADVKTIIEGVTP